MRRKIQALLLSTCLLTSVLCMSQGRSVTSWLTDPANGVFFQQMPSERLEKGADPKALISINDKDKYQSVDGFGFALTGGSAQHIIRMSKEARKALLTNLFATDSNHIGTSYIRLSIGASDLNEFVFSYNDLPAGETDIDLQKFDLGPDRKDVIPVMKEILAINPKIKIMASPWSPPAWMKDNKDTRGGKLELQYYEVYAKYLVRYVREMRKEGIIIDAITVQNEPLHPGNNPSLLMEAKDQLVFVRDYLGPAMQKANYKAKIIIYDHNCDKPEYPISILNDARAKPFIDGSAFHLYAGKIEALSKVHEAHPDKNVYFTEQWVGGPGDMKQDIIFHVRELIIGASRNWAKTVIEWNLAADSSYKPHTDRGGCETCLGAVTIIGNEFKKNPAYYVIAHASKYVRPGSVRIGSGMVKDFPNVAFRTPEGRYVLIVINDGKEKKAVSVGHNETHFISIIPAGAIATFVW